MENMVEFSVTGIAVPPWNVRYWVSSCFCFASVPWNLHSDSHKLMGIIRKEIVSPAL
jgi:hypothetical protein